MKQTLYDFIGVGRYAADAEVKAAILKKANVQRESGAVDQFDISLLKQASEILLNPDKRRSYDRSMEEAVLPADPPTGNREWRVNNGILLLCLPLAFSCASGLLVGLISIPLLAYNVIAGAYSLMVATTAALAAVEVSRNCNYEDGDEHRAFFAFLGMLILWPVYYPFYFSYRKKQGFPGHGLASIAVMVATVVLFFSPMLVAKQHQETAIRKVEILDRHSQRDLEQLNSQMQ
ncbi:hypothetical protein B0T40_16030 [Chromobacterium haemolyticum]|uniref:hypothetical protein n=1 Tax=Chromobacterium haemolyticum TaxID=394935 RepID=UPI0009DAEC5D|nr:hypothetical protein [Chromobacterium haemolyticum]OQS34102.1 hypothetical protein B0T40_16030 [Chromobacterium haemolyticum]